MALTVDQICDKTFQEQNGNYIRSEVDDYLNEICDTLDELNEKISTLEKQLADAQNSTYEAQEKVEILEASAREEKELLEKQLADAVARAEKAEASSSGERAVETVATPSELNEQGQAITLLGTAQRVVKQMREEAKKNADKIISQAQEEANSILSEAKNERIAISNEVENLRTQSSALRVDLQETIKKYQDMLLND